LNIEIIKTKINESIEHFMDNEKLLLKIDASERSITHKLAEYINDKFPEYDIDCEYNRNCNYGKSEPKRIQKIKEKWKRNMKKDWIQKIIGLINKRAYESYLFNEVSIYPDIIIHKRTEKKHNLLIIEVKKSNNKYKQKFDDWDKWKVKFLTIRDGNYAYNYSYGLLINFKITNYQESPELKWIKNGKEVK
jgi:hypothetical protein